MVSRSLDGFRLSNGLKLRFVAGSAALGFYGIGWWWQLPLIWLGLIDPKLFTVVGKTITRDPIKFRWANFPWIRFVSGGVVNKWSLANPGIEVFQKKIASSQDEGLQFIASIAPSPGVTSREMLLSEIRDMVTRLNTLRLTGIEINVSCPNTGGQVFSREVVVSLATCAVQHSRHPVLVKLSVAQDCVEIVEELSHIGRGTVHRVQGISINCVPVSMRFGKKQYFFGGSGGVSGLPAQQQNWELFFRLSKQNKIPVIAPSVMSKKDVEILVRGGATAVSMVALFWVRPWCPKKIVRSFN